MDQANSVPIGGRKARRAAGFAARGVMIAAAATSEFSLARPADADIEVRRSRHDAARPCAAAASAGRVAWRWRGGWVLLEIYVDADACPVKAEVERVAQRHGLLVYVVSNGGLRPNPDPRIRNVIVPEGPDAADDWIAEHIAEGDIAVTADIPLAARCLKKGAQVLGPTGKPFTDDSIGMALGMRDLKRHLREATGTQTYNPGFAKADRSRFLNALENAIQAVRRGSPTQ